MAGPSLWAGCLDMDVMQEALRAGRLGVSPNACVLLCGRHNGRGREGSNQGSGPFRAIKHATYIE